MAYLGELYLPAGRPPPRPAGAVTLVRAIHVPAEELCLLLLDAPSAAAVHAGLAGAGLAADRLLTVVHDGAGGGW